MQLDKQGSCKVPAVSANLSFLTPPIPSAPAMLSPSSQQSQCGYLPLPVKADSDCHSNRTRTKVDQSTSAGVTIRHQKVAALKDEDEDVGNNDSPVATIKAEVISIDDSESEDAGSLPPRESLSQLMVTASIQTER